MSIGVIADSYVAAVSGNSAYQSAVLADAPIAYYRLDDVAASGVMADSSGNARNGTYSASGATLDAAGARGAALAVDGTNGYGTVPYAAWMSTPAAALTLEAWVKPTSAAASQEIITRDSQGTTDATWRLRLNNGKPEFLFWHTGVTTVASPGLLSNGVWYHLVGVYDATAGTATIYVNGAQTAQVTGLSGNVVTSSTVALFLGRLGLGEERLNGSIDEAAIYATALSAARVLAHYNAGN